MIKISRHANFKHATLRYPSGNPVICFVSAIRKGSLYWMTRCKLPDGSFAWGEQERVYKTGFDVIGRVTSWPEAEALIEECNHE